jgi:hypothetical protein
MTPAKEALHHDTCHRSPCPCKSSTECITKNAQPPNMPITPPLWHGPCHSGVRGPKTCDPSASRKTKVDHLVPNPAVQLHHAKTRHLMIPPIWATSECITHMAPEMGHPSCVTWSASCPTGRILGGGLKCTRGVVQRA